MQFDRPDKKNDFLGQMNGELIKPGQIMEVIQNGQSFKQQPPGSVLPGLLT